VAEVARIPLYARNGSIRDYAMVDPADAAGLNQWRWFKNAGYAARGVMVDGRLKLILMHREILGLPREYDGRQGDHINRNRLDNRRSNLRIVTDAQNRQNKSPYRRATSRFRGVYWDKDKQRWRAQAIFQGRHYHLGYFQDEEETAKAASEWRTKHMPFAVEVAHG